MILHRSIDTLPVDCFMKVMQSINSGEPDFSWLIVRDEYFTPYNGEVPDDANEIWATLFYELERGQIDLKIQRAVAAVAYLRNKKLVSGDKSLQAEIDIKLHEIRQLTEEQKPFKMQDYYNTCANIEQHLGIRIVPFKTTARQYFTYVDMLKTYNNSRKPKRNV